MQDFITVPQGDDVQIAIRGYQDSDKHLILSTMLRGLYYGNSFFTNIQKDVFFKEYSEIAHKMLFKRSNSLTIACSMEEPTVVLGWALISLDASVLHYAFVKEPFRNKGIAKRLIGSNKIEIVTHITDLGNKIRRAKGWTFDPWKL